MKPIRACPICETLEVSLLQTMKFAAESNYILPDCYRIVSCNNCGFVYDDLEANEVLFERYYHNCTKYTSSGVGGSGGLTLIDRIRYREFLKLLFPFITKKMMIADVGCGKGGLLSFLSELGFQNLTGIEPSPGCVKAIQNQSKLEIICSDIKSLDSVRKFSLVIVSNVLEHVFNLHDAVKKLSEIITPNGMIAIEVPDASHYALLPHAPYYFFDMEHINHFDLNSMRNLWISMGFEVLVEETTTSFSVEGMENPICRLLVQKKKLEKSDKSFAFLKSDTATPIRQYIEWSQKKALTLPEAPENQQRFFLWGCGAYAKWFLKNKLSARPAGIVEVDTKKVGQNVDGCPIISPEMLMTENSEKTIVMISSVLYEQQIRKQLEKLKWKGQILSACRPREEQEY